MIDIKKAEAHRAEVNPPLRDTAPTESEVASSCPAGRAITREVISVVSFTVET